MNAMASLGQIESGIDTALFTKVVQLAAVFRNDTAVTQPLSVEIRYSTINAHPLTGLVRGTSVDYENLEKFFLKQKHPICSLESTSRLEGRERIRCRDVLLRRLVFRQYAADELTTINQVIAHFEIGQLEIERQFQSEISKVRNIVFFLEGPSRMWVSHALRTISYTGNTETRVPMAELMLDTEQGLSITARPHFLYASHRESRSTAEFQNLADGEDQRPLKTSIEVETFALNVAEVRTEAAEAALEHKGASFEARALAITEKLCLLVSFLSKRQVTWFAQTLTAPTSIIEIFQHAKTAIRDEPRVEDLVIAPTKAREFLAKAAKAYDDQKTKGVDLRLPILLYVYAQMVPFVEEHFMALFRILEMLVDALDRRSKGKALLTKGELSAIRRSVTTDLVRFEKTEAEMELIYEKLPELRRPAFWHRLLSHLQKFEVELSDIGGVDGLRKMITIRNPLVHAAREVPIEQTVREISRAETIVERLLMKLLGWQTSSNTPTYRNRDIETVL